MNDHLSKKSPLSPIEQLANVYRTLADDVFDAPLDVDEETTRRACHIASAARDTALASNAASGSIVDSPSQPPSLVKYEKVIGVSPIEFTKKDFQRHADVPPDSNTDPTKPARPTKPPRH